jgi:tetratricopeptide (TPR) repeat protein
MCRFHFIGKCGWDVGTYFLLFHALIPLFYGFGSIGRIYFHQDKYEEAIDYVEQALKIKENALHERHISLAETQHLLGSLLIKKGSSSAVPLLKEALITYKGKKDCEVLKSDVLDLLATAYMKKGDNRYAILSLEQSLKIKTKILGPDDLACANVLMILGKLKAKTENVDGALVAFKEGMSYAIICVFLSSNRPH